MLIRVGCANSYPDRSGIPRVEKSRLILAPTSSIANIVPRPQFLNVSQGLFVWPKTVLLSKTATVSGSVVEALRSVLDDHRITLKPRSSTFRPAEVQLSIESLYDGQIGDEGYRLQIKPDGVEIIANTDAGLFYGIQSLDQVINRSASDSVSLNMTVRDFPTVRWRGILLDVSRHFFSTDVIKRLLLVSAHLKLNVFQWHLVDDEGWRLPVNAFPRLTATRLCRANCGFYTDAEIRDVVDFAKQHFITVVPEIEFPAHSAAAIQKYPELACNSSASSDVLCPTSFTFDFLSTIFNRTAALFPGLYVHIGGDEFFRKNWSGPSVSQVLRKTQLTNIDDLVSYSEDRVASLVKRNLRRPILWDDALDSRVPANAVIMAWQGDQRALQAIRLGHDVIMSPDATLYFDGYQGDRAQEPIAMRFTSTLRNVYDYNPLALATDARVRARILGAQACLWTEHISTTSHLYYMLLPREIALAESLWTPANQKSWKSFQERLPFQFEWLHRHQFTYRIPNPEIFIAGSSVGFRPVIGKTQDADVHSIGETVEISLAAPIGAKIYYTFGQSVNQKAALYVKPFKVLNRKQPIRLSAHVINDDGRSSTESSVTLRRTRVNSLQAPSASSWDELMSSQKPDLYLKGKN